MKKTNIRVLTQVAMLVALQVILSKFCSISTDSLRIGFGFVPMVICGMLYGPLWTAAAYAVADIIGAILIYGYANPFITVSVALTGLGYGFFLHREEPRFFPHVVLAAGCSLFCSMIIRIPQGIGLAIAEPVLIPILLQLGRRLRKHGLAAAV